MLGPAFTRNSVTGKLFRTGALKARSGMGLAQRSRPAERRQFRQPEVRVPEGARGGQASSFRETARGRACSSRARRCGFRQEGRGSLRDQRHRAPQRQGRPVPLAGKVRQWRRACLRRTKSPWGLLRNPCRHRLSERERASPCDPGSRSANRPRSRQERGRFWRGNACRLRRDAGAGAPLRGKFHFQPAAPEAAARARETRRTIIRPACQAI